MKHWNKKFLLSNIQDRIYELITEDDFASADDRDDFQDYTESGTGLLVSNSGQISLDPKIYSAVVSKKALDRIHIPVNLVLQSKQPEGIQ